MSAAARRRLSNNIHKRTLLLNLSDCQHRVVGFLPLRKSVVVGFDICSGSVILNFNWLEQDARDYLVRLRPVAVALLVLALYQVVNLRKRADLVVDLRDGCALLVGYLVLCLF